MYKTSAKKLQIELRDVSRIAPNLEYEKHTMLYNSFLLSNFNYCPLIWMFSGKSSSNGINRIHKHALRVLLDYYGYTFEKLLQKRGKHTIHTRNLQALLLEVYKCLTSKNTPCLWYLLERRPKNYNLRIKDLVQLPNRKTMR